MRKKYNNQYANYYSFGDYIRKNVGNIKDIGLKAIQDDTVLSSLGLAGNQLASSAISGGLNSGVGSGISQVGNQVGSLVGKVNPLLGSMVQVGSGIVGGLTNRAFGSKINEENVESVNQNISELSNFNSNAADFDTFISNQQSAPVAYNFNNSFIGKDGWFSNKAKNKAKALRNELNLAEAFRDRAIINNAQNIETERSKDLFSNFKSFGGVLNLEAQGGKIEINPKNKGKFNVTKERTGKTTEELTHSKNPLTRKRAIFAQNAAKWNHSNGGFINIDPNFNMGIQYINEGGTHKENPYGGVQIGVDNEGVPNLVEEGEIIYNNYVFSNRINMPNKVKNKYKLRETKPITFAEGIKQLSKEYEETPNDIISKRGLDAMMNDLMQEQESLKQKKEERQYKKGGFLNIYEDGTPNIEVKPRKDLIQKRRITEAEAIAALNTEEKLKQQEEAKKAARLTNLRYAPVIQSGINAITDAFGITNAPDYTASRAILANLRNSGRVPEIRYTPVSNYLQYTPLDTRLQVNDLNAAANASRGALTNSGGTAAQRMAAILAADNAYMQNLGRANVEASEANLRRRQQVEDFNRATNQYNAQASLQAQQANAQIRVAEKERANATFNAAIEAMAKERELSDATKAANLNNLYQNLGNLGIEELSWNRLRSMSPVYSGYSIDRSGALQYNNAAKMTNEINPYAVSNKNGGCITTKKKRK